VLCEETERENKLWFQRRFDKNTFFPLGLLPYLEGREPEACGAQQRGKSSAVYVWQREREGEREREKETKSEGRKN